MRETTPARTGHVDTFCAERLPPRELWPVRDWTGVPELAYPPRLNCAVELLDRTAESRGDSPVLRFPGGEWTYGELVEKANRIAHVLVDDLGIVPGNRVLLRAPNTPMLAACWFAVLKVGGVVVCTMPLLRERELQYLADKAEISLALSDARVAPDCEQAFRTRRQMDPEGALIRIVGEDVDRQVDQHAGRARVEPKGVLDAGARRLDVEAFELRAAQIDPRVQEIRCNFDGALQQLFGLSVVLGVHRNQRQQPQRLDMTRVASQDLAIDRLRLFETSCAVVLGRLCEELSCRIGPQECLHELFSLVRATGLLQRAHQRELRRLQLRVEFERAAQSIDGFVGAAELQQAATKLLVTLGVAGLLFERASQQWLGLAAATLGVQCRAEQREQVRLTWNTDQCIAA